MRIRRYGEVRDVSPDDGGVLVTVVPERSRDWTDLPRGAVVTVEVEDSPLGLVQDMAQWRGNLSEDAVRQLQELRPRLLEFLDRAVDLEEQASR